jgi:hypothetical protein
MVVVSFPVRPLLEGFELVFDDAEGVQSPLLEVV